MDNDKRDKKKKITAIVLLVLTFLILSIVSFANQFDDTKGTGKTSGSNGIQGYGEYGYESSGADSGDDYIYLHFFHGAKGTTPAVDKKYNPSIDATKAPNNINYGLKLKGNSFYSALQSMCSKHGWNYDSMKSDCDNFLSSKGYTFSDDGIVRASGYNDKSDPKVYKYLTALRSKDIRHLVHTVKYNSNGGDSTPSDQTKKEGIKLNLSSDKPGKTGWKFDYWNCPDLKNNFASGADYDHDQDGGTVTMYAIYKDEESPAISDADATASNKWSNSSSTHVSFKVSDSGSGVAHVKVTRYDTKDGSKNVFETTYTYDLKKQTTTGKSFETVSFDDTHSEQAYYTIECEDAWGNSAEKKVIYSHNDINKPWLDEEAINKTREKYSVWTNMPSGFDLTAKDYDLNGKDSYCSGLVKLELSSDSGTYKAGSEVVGRNVVPSNAYARRDRRGETTSRVWYSLLPCDEGRHVWTINATDQAGNVSSENVTTLYDCTRPYIEGASMPMSNKYTEPNFRKTKPEDMDMLFGYVHSNIIDETIDDKPEHNPRNPNLTSGLKKVVLSYYDYKHDRMRKVRTVEFDTPDPNSSCHIYYDTNDKNDDDSQYYLITATDWAGNVTRKKIYTLKHFGKFFAPVTHIDRSTYD